MALPSGDARRQDACTSQFVMESAGSVLAVRQSRDDSEPLLLLHGGPGVPDYLQAATAPILPGFRCISFDQRGTGASACRDGRYDLAAYLDDIAAIRTWAGVASWHVLGHSWGGLPGSAPDPDPAWLAGCSPVAMIKTDRAVTREHPDALKGAPGYDGPVLVLYGADDIFADGTEIPLSGKEFDLLLEGTSTESDLLLEGRTAMHAPEIDGKVFVNDYPESHAPQKGEFYRCRINAAHDYDLVAEIV